MQATVIILLLLSGTVALILGVAALLRRSSALALPFAVTMFCGAIWNFCFAVEILSPSLEGKLFWANMQFLGIAFLPAAWLVMTLVTTGQPRHALRMAPVLGAVPALTLIIAWTNAYHHLFRQNPEISTLGVPFPVLTNHYSLYFYAIHAPYGYLLFALSLYILIRSLHNLPSVYRRQRFTLVLSLLLPLLVDLLYVLGVTPVPFFNFTPVFFTITGILLAINVLQFRFLDILPLAYEAAINEMGVGVIVLDAQGRVSHLNPAFEGIVGITNNEAIGKDVAKIFPDLAQMLGEFQNQAELAVRQGSEERTYQVTHSAITRGKKDLAGRVVTLNDITERVRLHHQVEKLSITDPLTGAVNRRGLRFYGEHEIHRARRCQHMLSVILLDIDDFKRINDQFGHQAGDRVLIEVVQKIRCEIRAMDVVSRYGGDEFVLLLPETDRLEVEKIARRLHDEVSYILADEKPDSPNRVAVSLGITCLLVDDCLESLLQRADQALYQAKASGKGQTVIL